MEAIMTDLTLAGAQALRVIQVLEVRQVLMVLRPTNGPATG
jgi:hypothetical protein